LNEKSVGVLDVCQNTVLLCASSINTLQQLFIAELNNVEQPLSLIAIEREDDFDFAKKLGKSVIKVSC
jgi:hypothetical protein